jgi:Protein of unknown function (DUF3995)
MVPDRFGAGPPQEVSYHAVMRSSEPTANWPAYAACVVALLYAVVSFYWAFGGTAGVGTLGGQLEELGRAGDPVVLWLAGIAGVLKVAGAVLALALVRPWGRVVPRRVLLGAARAGAVGLVGYGGLYVVGGVLVLSGVVEVAGAVDRAALWWRVLVWDLWFLVWGVLLGLATWRAGRLTAVRAGGPRGGG